MRSVAATRQEWKPEGVKTLHMPGFQRGRLPGPAGRHPVATRALQVRRADQPLNECRDPQATVNSHLRWLVQSGGVLSAVGLLDSLGKLLDALD
jgi:hypothetical protein